MINPEDFEPRDAVGSIDRIVTNIGMAILAVWPTLVVAMVMPWKLSPFLENDDADGRRGLLLAPGVFFLLCLTVVMLTIASFVSEDMVTVNNGFIGPALALSVFSAVSEGDIWRTISVIAPIYVVALVIAAIGIVLKPLIGVWWTLRSSLRAAMYVIALVVSYIAITSLIIDSVGLVTGDRALIRRLYAINSLPIVLLVGWAYFGLFLGHDGKAVRAALLALGMMALIALPAILVNAMM